VRRVLACERAVVVPRVLGSKGGVVIHVDVGRRSGRYRDGTRRGHHHPNQGDGKNKMGQGAKQAHGREANDALPA
jgi:hypothetical protein